MPVLIGSQSISEPRLCTKDLWARRVCFELLAQLADENPNELRVGLGVGSPNAFEYLPMRHHSPRALGEKRQKAMFSPGQADFLAA